MKGYVLIRDEEDPGSYHDTLPFRLLRSRHAADRAAKAALDADENLNAVVIVEYDANGYLVSDRFVRRKRPRRDD